MYCPYCGITHDDRTVATSVEHIVPYGLGGSDALTILVCKGSNDTLGADVDAPFMDFFPVRCSRFFLGLESTKGNPPTLDLGGTSWIDGKEVRISYSISADSKELKIAKPKVVKTGTGEGKEHWQVSGDPADVREIIEGKLRKSLKLGKSVTAEDGSALHLENIDSLFPNPTVTQNPSVVKTLDFDYLVSIRFFSKVALAMGYLHLGEAFAKSSTGEILRRHMTVRTWGEVSLPGAIWPETDSVKRTLQFIAKKDHHMIAIMEGDPQVLLVSLFGEYDAFVPLGRPAEGVLTTVSGRGTVWRIELPSRRLSMITVDDLIAERSQQARRKASEELRP